MNITYSYKVILVKTNSTNFIRGNKNAKKQQENQRLS
jgi:hypothetical protein